MGNNAGKKTAFITGAASGIGKEMALVFAKAGIQVAIADLNLEGATATATELQKQTGTKLVGVAADVANEEQVNAAVEKTVKDLGSVDILISNAGIQIVHPIEEFSFDEWKKIMSIHVDGAFLTTKACYTHMKKQGTGGKIIYTGSVHSKEASKLKAAYVTAKHALIGLCKTVAKEGGEFGIGANVICPGYVMTPLVKKQIPEQAKALGISEEDVIKKVMLKDTVDGEFTSVEDVANTALFLAQMPSLALTGQSIVISHGWFMQ
jgi:3-hydroxybutyrate dehydrogenase